MAENNRIPFRAESFSLLKEFNPSEIDNLEKIAEVLPFKDGEIIVRQGDLSEEVYFIGQGAVDIVSEETQMVLSTLHAGESFGELAFLDGSPRSVTIRANGDIELYALTKSGLLNYPDDSKFLAKLYHSIAIDSSEKLKKTTSNYAQSLRNELAMLKEKGRFQQFLITTLVGSSVVLTVSDYAKSQLPQSAIYTDLFAWIYLTLMVAPTLYFALKSEIPAREFGLNLRNWKKALIEGAAITAVCMIIMFGAFFYMCANQMYGLPENPQFSILPFFTLKSLLYFLHSSGQEFLSRGIFLGALLRFLGSKKQAIFLSSMVFSLSHVPYGIALVLPTLIGGVLFSLLYLRHRNLIGVTFVHWALGATLFAILHMIEQGSP